MKKYTFLVLFIFILMMTACQNTKEEEINLLDPIEVELTMETELVINDEMTTKAIITQNDRAVTDANEVVFEIWQHGNSETYQKLDGINIGDGVYEVNWVAEEEGVYYIFYHVTARGMHRMKKHQFVFGDVDVEKILETPDERPNRHMH